MNDLVGILREMLRIADHTVIKSSSDRNQHIAMLHCHIGFISPVHPGHPDKLGIT